REVQLPLVPHRPHPGGMRSPVGSRRPQKVGDLRPRGRSRERVPRPAPRQLRVPVAVEIGHFRRFPVGHLPTPGCRRPNTKYETGRTPAELMTVTAVAHSHLEPRTWAAGRRFMSTSDATL